ncbi:MAG: hypothetical protein GXN92_00835 [Candidatus Micrarchaeota archaeon]|nr:hypothetical protein [Candidatus Micrarchaeota archaeon]
MNRREFIKKAGKAVVGTMVGASAFSRPKAATEDYITLPLKPQFVEWLEKQSSGMGRLISRSNIAFDVKIERYPEVMVIRSAKPIRGDYIAPFTSVLSEKVIGPSRNNEVALSSYYDVKVVIPIRNGKPANRAYFTFEYKGNFWLNVMVWGLGGGVAAAAIAYALEGTRAQKWLAQREKEFKENLSNLF